MRASSRTGLHPKVYAWLELDGEVGIDAAVGPRAAWVRPPPLNAAAAGLRLPSAPPPSPSECSVGSRAGGAQFAPDAAAKGRASRSGAAVRLGERRV